MVGVQEVKQKMAARLIKQLVFGKKNLPPQPPKPDYTAIKSTSTESSLARSPTSDRSSTSLPPTTSQLGEFEVPQLPGSPHRVAPTEKGGFGGARPKDSGGGVSPKSAPGDRASVSLADEPETPGADQKENTEGAVRGPGASATPPRLLDEYSDPVDLKRQIQDEHDDMLGINNEGALGEDDYSVPYEVKKLFKERQQRGAEGGFDSDSPSRVRTKGPRLYDDPYEEPVASGLPPLNRSYPPPEATDMRPKEDYDEPWEWSAKHSQMLQSQFESVGHNVIPPHFISDTNASETRTPQLKRTAPGPASGSKSGEDDGLGSGSGSGSGGLGSPVDLEGVIAEPLGQEAAGEVEAPVEAVVEAEAEADVDEDTYEATDSYMVTRTKGSIEPDSDDEGYTPLQSEFGPSGPKPPNGGSTEKSDNQRVGNYEEPWDLTSKQKELEDKIKAASDRASREKAKSNVPPPHESDTRSQEGYEKPWDWKPHQKDDRPQEGYEKPWDWKPHQKDDRPPEEYEEPWDQRATELERDLLLGKSGSGSPTSSTSPTTTATTTAATTTTTITTTTTTTSPASVIKDNKEDDTRPPGEYDEPWDSRKKQPVSRTGSSSEGSPKPSQAVLSSQNQSPKKKDRFTLDLGPLWNTLGERVDPRLPLEQQVWYHGSISRVDAESLLRVHKEGSYLVRMSESNKMDFSLSLKSTRGFMHMKIVNRDKGFILGQFSQPFDTIPQMIHHYSISKLPIKGAEHMSLLHPIMNELL